MKLTMKELFNIPNMLGYFRLALVPVFVCFYLREQYMYAAVAAILSGLSDLVDGWFARKFDQVTDLGKVLDPMADKLSQGAAVICLTSRYDLMYLLVAIWFVKEGYMAAAMFYYHKKHDIRLNGAIMVGKVCTMVLDCVMVLLLLFPALPVLAANCMILVCAGLMLLSLTRYILEYRQLMAEKYK